MSSKTVPILPDEAANSDNFWVPLYFLGFFFVFAGILYFYAYTREVRDLRKFRQTLLIDEPANESHRHYILSVSISRIIDLELKE